MEINCGISQGSVPGPLLFLTHINDLPSVSELLSFCVFADDTNIFQSKITLQKVMNRELKKLKMVRCQSIASEH